MLIEVNLQIINRDIIVFRNKINQIMKRNGKFNSPVDPHGDCYIVIFGLC